MDGPIVKALGKMLYVSIPKDVAEKYKIVKGNMLAIDWATTNTMPDKIAVRGYQFKDKE